MQSKSTSKREVLKGISLHVINKSDRWDCRGCDGPAEPSSKPVRLRAAALPSHPLPEQRSHSSEEITRCTAWVESREGSHGDFFSSSAFTNLQRAFQAKPHLFSMKMERLWFLPVGVGEPAPGSTWLWTRAPQVLLTQNVLEVLCSFQQKGVGRWLWGR